MILLFVCVGMILASLLLVAMAMWAVGRTRKGGPRRRFGAYVAVAAAAAVAGAILNAVASRIQVDTQQAAIVAMVILLGAQAAAVAVLIAALLGVRGKPTLVYLAAYIGANIVLSALTLGVVRPHVMEAFSIPTAGMAPTLEAGDHLLTSKYGSPRRWDVVVYNMPNQRGVRYVKRLVALPGESLTIKEGGIWIDGQRQPQPEAIKDVKYAAISTSPGPRMLVREGEPFQIPDGQCFVIGDNVGNSLDSRYTGPLPFDHIVGVAEFTYWPVSRWRFLR